MKSLFQVIAKGIFTRYAILAVILISSPLYATPVISVITDTNNVVQGGTLTISGSNFTSYTPTTGAFDTFETGGFNAYWAFHNDLHIGTLNQRTTFSIYSATDTLNSGLNDHAQLQGGGTTARSWYVSFWWYVGSNWVWGTTDFSGTHKWLSNIKLIRFWNPGTAVENCYLAFTGWNNQLMFLKEGYSPPNTETLFLNNGHRPGTSSSPATELKLNTWHQFRAQFVDSSSLGAADGSMELWFDTMTILNESGEVFKDAEDKNKRPQAVGFDNVWSCTEGTPDTGGCFPGDYYMDDVYAVDSISRVEICDQSTYTACGVPPEIQKINTWTDTDISIFYNGGSLTSGTTKYVFVIDNNGVASAGFPLQGPGGGGGGGNNPGTPHTGLNGQSKINGKAFLK